MKKEFEKAEKIYGGREIETIADEIMERMDELKKRIKEDIFWFE